MSESKEQAGRVEVREYPEKWIIAYLGQDFCSWKPNEERTHTQDGMYDALCRALLAGRATIAAQAVEIERLRGERDSS